MGTRRLLTFVQVVETAIVATREYLSTMALPFGDSAEHIAMRRRPKWQSNRPRRRAD